MLPSTTLATACALFVTFDSVRPLSRIITHGAANIYELKESEVYPISPPPCLNNECPLVLFFVGFSKLPPKETCNSACFSLEPNNLPSEVDKTALGVLFVSILKYPLPPSAIK